MSTKKIVLIDDDRLAILISKSLLEKSDAIKNGVEITTFLFAQDAITYLESQSKENLMDSLILLDINMPMMDGFQFLDQLQLKGLSAYLKVVMLTSSIAYEDKDKADEYSCVVDYFSKPLDFAKIDRVIKLLEYS